MKRWRGLLLILRRTCGASSLWSVSVLGFAALIGGLIVGSPPRCRSLVRACFALVGPWLLLAFQVPRGERFCLLISGRLVLSLFVLLWTKNRFRRSSLGLRPLSRLPTDGIPPERSGFLGSPSPKPSALLVLLTPGWAPLSFEVAQNLRFFDPRLLMVDPRLPFVGPRLLARSSSELSFGCPFGP